MIDISNKELIGASATSYPYELLDFDDPPTGPGTFAFVAIDAGGILCAVFMVGQTDDLSTLPRKAMAGEKINHGYTHAYFHRNADSAQRAREVDDLIEGYAPEAHR